MPDEPPAVRGDLQGTVPLVVMLHGEERSIPGQYKVW